MNFRIRPDEITLHIWETEMAFCDSRDHVDSYFPEKVLEFSADQSFRDKVAPIHE